MRAGVVRVAVIAANTFVEAARQRVFNVLLVFGLVVMAGAYFFSPFTFQEQVKFIKDFCLGAMGLVGVLMGVALVAQMVPQEMESRTLFTILSKPVRRAEFICGKFFGAAALLLAASVLMGLFFGAVLLAREQAICAGLEQGVAQGGADALAVAESCAKVRAEVRDPALLLAAGLLYAKLLVVAAVAVALSSFSSSMVFTAVVSGLVYILGHLQGPARDVWLDPVSGAGPAQVWFVRAAGVILPDFSVFDIMDEIVAGHASAAVWSQGFAVAGYAGVYVAVLLAVASLVFEGREL